MNGQTGIRTVKKSAVMPYQNGLSEGTGSRYYRNGGEGKRDPVQTRQKPTVIGSNGIRTAVRRWK